MAQAWLVRLLDVERSSEEELLHERYEDLATLLTKLQADFYLPFCLAFNI
jgi:hypothetical protein